MKLDENCLIKANSKAQALGNGGFTFHDPCAVRAIIQEYCEELPADDALIVAIKERAWMRGRFLAVYLQDVEEIIRQRQSDKLIDSCENVQELADNVSGVDACTDTSNPSESLNND